MGIQSKLIFIFILLYTFLCFPQQVTFEKVLSRLGASRNTFSVLEYPGNCFIFSMEGHNNFSLYCLDSQGKFLWSKTIQGQYVSLLKRNENVTVLFSSYPDLKIVNFGLDGEELSSASVHDPIYEALAVGNESNIYVSTFEGNSVKLLKLDQNFNIIWQKTNDVLSGLVTLKKILFQAKDGSLYLGLSKGVIKFDTSGSLLIRNDVYGVKNFFELPNGRVYFFDNSRRIWEIKEDGHIVFSRVIPADIRNINYTFDNGIIVCLEDSVARFDSAGNTIWKKKFNGSAQKGLQTSDHGFIFYGIYNDPFDQIQYPWTLKTEGNGNHTSINIYFPENPVIPYSFEEFICRYITNFPFINAYVSYNTKDSWELIESNISGDSGHFKWDPILSPGGNCYLKITNAENESFYDETDNAISLQIFKSSDYIAANQIKMWIKNNGTGSFNPEINGPGFYWPGGENAALTSVFIDGLVWGGIVNSETRFNGSTYRSGIVPGKILEGNIPSIEQNKSRIYKIRRGWENLPEGKKKEKLKADYNEWPGEFGAPFEDIDGDAVYTQGIDRPLFIGDEVLFYLSNDLDTAAALFAYGSLPIGLEFQTTIWAYDSANYLKDVVFKRYLVINKSNNTVDSMYFGYWSDDDLGYPWDDLGGCDINLKMGFTYNGDNHDQDYYLINPPAVSHMILQGPIIKSAGDDSAKYKNRWINGFKNLGLASFTLFAGGIVPFNDPPLGEFTGTLEFYNVLKGFLLDGSEIIDPVTHNSTKFYVSGDPEAGEGWYDGSKGWPGGPPPYDRRQVLSSGPFTFAPGDTQEVVIAIFMAQGTNNLNSVTELKNTAVKLQEFWKNAALGYSKGQIIPERYVLYQNYPNPFNPLTTIRYELPEWSQVELKVYDILGREMTVLVNKEQPAGKYSLEMNSGRIGNGLASGVYIYKLRANNYVSSKKMLLIK